MSVEWHSLISFILMPKMLLTSVVRVISPGFDIFTFEINVFLSFTYDNFSLPLFSPASSFMGSMLVLSL